MHRITLPIIVLMLILFTALLGACGNEDNSIARDDPLQLVQDFIAATEALNIDTLKQLACDPDDLPVSGGNLKLQFSDQRFTEDQRSDTDATIMFAGHFRLLAGAVQQEGDVMWSFELEKQSDGWCVAGLDGDLFGLAGNE